MKSSGQLELLEPVLLARGTYRLPWSGEYVQPHNWPSTHEFDLAIKTIAYEMGYKGKFKVVDSIYGIRHYYHAAPGPNGMQVYLGIPPYWGRYDKPDNTVTLITWPGYRLNSRGLRREQKASRRYHIMITAIHEFLHGIYDASHLFVGRGGHGPLMVLMIHRWAKRFGIPKEYWPQYRHILTAT